MPKYKSVDIERESTTLGDEGSGYITGYASTWIRRADSWGDVVARGAFADTIAEIAESGRAVPLLWNHESQDMAAYIGTVTSLEEDEHGLLFTAGFG